MDISLKLKVKSLKLSIRWIVVFVFITTPFSFVWGYPIEGLATSPIDEANKLSQSINETVRNLLQNGFLKSLTPISNFKYNPEVNNPTAAFNINLINKESFSGQDVWGVLRAIAVLFLQIVATALGVLLGILKVILELLTSWR